MATKILRRLRELLDVDTTGAAPGDALVLDVDGETWVPGEGGGAPEDATYLVATASGDLTAEVVVGTTPGGELGGTWASPTVDATHSGSSHAGVQAAAEATAAAALAAHEGASDPHPGYTTAAELAAYAQPVDSDLTAIAALTTTAFGRGLLELANSAALLSAAGAAAASHAHAGEDITSGTVADARIASTIARDSEVTSAIAALSSVYQPLDSDLTAIAALSTTSFGRSLLAAADAAALRTLAAISAANTPITDAGSYFTGTDVEAALQELGAGGGGGSSAVAGEIELDYAQITSPGSPTVVAAASAPSMITGHAITLDGSTEICIEVYSPWVEATSVSNGLVTVTLWEDSTQLGVIGVVGTGAGSKTEDGPLFARMFRTPAAGSHTYSVRAYAVGSTGYFGAGAGGSVEVPAYLRVSRSVSLGSGDTDLQTVEAKLAADVTLTNADTFYDVLSASLPAGKWLVTWKVLFTPSGNSTQYHGWVARLTDGTTIYDEQEKATHTLANGDYRGEPHACVGTALVTVAATTTIKITAECYRAGSKALRDVVYGSGSSHTATHITAVKLDDIIAADGVLLKSGLFDAYALLRDEKTSGTGGGTFTSGAWRTRALNTEKADTAGIVSLASDQFTLQPGTYLIRATAPALGTNEHKAKLYNVTDAADVILGTSEFSGQQISGSSTADSRSAVTGVVTIASAKTFEIQHRATTTQATYGLGAAGSFGTEVYTEVEIYRVTLNSGQTPGEFVGAKAYSDATQALSGGTTTALTFNQEEFDSDGFHDTSSNTSRFTIPAGKAGKYLLQGGAFVDAASDWMGFRLNGSTKIRGFQTTLGSGAVYRSCTAIVDLAAGDYVELVASASSANFGHATLPDAQKWMAISRLVGTALTVYEGSSELAYVEGTADVTVSATSEGTPTDVISAGALTFDGSTRICIEFYVPTVQPDTGVLVVNLWEGSTNLGYIGECGPTANGYLYLKAYLTPAAGSRTYKIRAWRATANVTLKAGSGGSGAWRPMFIRISRA